MPPEIDPSTEAPKPRGLSITSILMGGIGGIVAVSLAATLWLGFSLASENATELLRLHITRLIDGITEEVTRHLEPAAVNSRFTADYYGRLDRMPDARDLEHLRAALALASQIQFSAFFHKDGNAFLYGRGNKSRSQDWRSDPDITRIVRELGSASDVQWQGPVFSGPLKQTLIPATAPVHRNGRYIGVAGTSVSTRNLSRFVASLDVTGGAAFILHGKDHVIAHPLLIEGFLDGLVSHRTPLLKTQQTNDLVLMAFQAGRGDDLFILDRAQTDIKGRAFVIDGEEYVLLYREITRFGAIPWQIGAYLKVSEAEGGDVWTKLMLSISLGLGLMAATLVILVLVARAIRRPVLELARISDRVRDLDFSAGAPIPRSIVRELNQAGEAFGRMIDGLRLFETYVPKNMVSRLLGSTDAGISEERLITLMFTDIAGFTSMAEKMSASQIAALLNAHFTLLNEHVEAQDGTVDKYIGDSMMAFWGAPDDQADHAARGCEAILGIADAVRADNAARAARGQQPFKIRIGLHTGPVIAGNIGAPGRVNYTVVGDTVNVANRLEQLGKDIAPDDDVVLLVSRDVVERAGAAFSFEEIGAFDIRGRESSLDVFRLRSQDESAAN
ncbi:MAG: adenylate/guanylate cyclase domain-containing protein [Alphaproteobacteria bacterium]|nr:adenylate/guanylate cyclase domain-containing protein [Alphaproteobacteria bacterium]